MLAGKKILIVHSSAELYGSDRCLLSAARGLVANGVNLHVTVPSTGPLVAELTNAGAVVHILDPIVFRREVLSVTGLVNLFLKAPFATWQLVRLIRREHFDLIHTNTGVIIGGAVAAGLTRTPHVWQFREILEEFGWMLRLYEPFVLMLSKRVVSITAAVQAQFFLKGFKLKGSIINDGIPAGQFDFTKAEREDDRFVLTTVGRLAPYKGQDVFLKALALAIQNGINLEAYIVGDVYGNRFGYREELKQLASKLGLDNRVKFVGFQTQIQPFLEKCNLFVIPSIRPEGLGIVILEAMMSGRAVIATAGGGAAEVISNREDGILIPPGDFNAMAAAIIQLAQNEELRKSLASGGKRKAKAYFSEDVMIKKLINLYEHVIVE
ncbi:MAG: glycosyltransferase [Actinobacteria bacterium]|nr:glycosyltransferase [Actinomycetota bacterium]